MPFYGLFPPEVNSGMFDAGLGPIHFGATAINWGVLAASFAAQSAAASVQIGASLAVWQGGAPVAFQIASSNLLAWLQKAQAVSAENALAAKAVVDSWTAARLTMVPLPVVTANRSAASAAEATTFAAAAAGPIGAPIAVASAATAAQLEAAYAAMWATDAMTMNVYHGTVVTATTPKVLPPPPVMGGSGVVAEAASQGVANSAMSAGRESAMAQGQQMAQTAGQQAMGSPAQMMGMGRSGISDAQFNSMLSSRGLDPSAYAAPDFGQMAGFAGAGMAGGGGGAGMSGGASVRPSSAALSGVAGVPPAEVFGGVAPMPMAAGAPPASPMGMGGGGGGGGMMPPMSPGAGANRATGSKATKSADVIRAHPEFGELLMRDDTGFLRQVTAGMDSEDPDLAEIGTSADDADDRVVAEVRPA